jgi:hypothetical protein
VRCPRCRELASEGAAICENCSEILDSSLLDGAGEMTPIDGERAGIGPSPNAPVRRAASPGMPDRLRRQTQTAGGWNPRPGAPQPEPDRHQFLAPEPAMPPPSPTQEARKAAGDLGSFFRSLSAADRWAAGATTAMLLLLALPWRWDRDDDEIIGVVSAWPLLLLGGAVLLLVYLRARRAGAALDRRLRYAQVVASAACAAFNGGYLRWAAQSHVMRALGVTVAVVISTPQASAYAGLGCAVLAFFASATLLKMD